MKLKKLSLALGLFTFVSGSAMASEVLSSLLDCHEGLVPYLNGVHAHHRFGRLVHDVDYWKEVQDGEAPLAEYEYAPEEKNRMRSEAKKKREQYGPANLIVSGTRKGTLGVYVLEQTPKGAALHFYPLPKPEGNESVEVSKSSDAAEGSTKKDEYDFRVYHIAVPIGGRVQKMTFAGRFNGPGQDRPMYLTCNWDCDIGTSPFAGLRGESIRLDDQDATKAFLDTLITELSNPEEKFHVHAGFGHLRPEDAIQNCLKHFPEDSPLGKLIVRNAQSIIYIEGNGTRHDPKLDDSKSRQSNPDNH